ncbi:MAG: NlpC/P60 family protein [Methylococcales bacterium]|nr:NlpC/P60 family protein [Methylococcales bacterium]
MIKLLTLLTITFLVGCTGAPKTKLTQVSSLKPVTWETPFFVKKPYNNPLKCSITPLTAEEKSVKRSIELLEKFFEEWKAVKHRMGGLSKRGVDCSGFVQLTFLNQFDLKVPRTTGLQVKLGKSIPKNKLKTGDLVFFKTSPRVRHVGIYLKDNIFIHTSSSKGVMKSKLNKGYWAKKYWKAKRVAFKTTDFFSQLIRREQV